MKTRNERDFEKADKRDKPFLTVACVVFALYTASLIFPFVWMFINSFKDKTDFFVNPMALPKAGAICFENYSVIFETYNLGEMFLNSFILCICIPTLAVFATCSVAHGVANHSFKLNKAMYTLALSVMFIPVAGSLATTFKLMYDTRLINTHIGVILLSSSGFGFNFLMLHSVYKGVSPTYAEAAKIDGAGYWRTFLQIVSPQVSPVIIAVWILSFIGVWNDYATPYLFLNGYPTLSVGVFLISEEAELHGDYPMLFAVILVVTLPMIALFFAFQDKIMHMSMGGGIKE